MARLLVKGGREKNSQIKNPSKNILMEGERDKLKRNIEDRKKTKNLKVDVVLLDSGLKNHNNVKPRKNSC